MSRASKYSSVARYITSRSGIPGLISNGTYIEGPPPYEFWVSTDAANWRFWEAMKNLDDDKITGVIRYDKFLGSINDAVVGVTLPTFCRLLNKHYESIQDRVQTHIKGE